MKDRFTDFLFWSLGLVFVTGYVAWRFLTCCVDSWEDIRHGRIPAFIRTGQPSERTP